jgi:tetratricopeptide (TPR) repeat protein
MLHKAAPCEALGLKNDMTQDSRFPAWAWWIIGALTILAVSILIFSLVLGVRAGQQQVETQRRQQIGIALQRATDFQAEGNLPSALDEYQKILVLDPSNDLARQGIEALLVMARSGQAAATLPTATPAATAAADTATSPLSGPTSAPAATTATPAAGLATYWATAQNAARAGRWQEVLTNLLLIQQSDPTFNRTEVTEQLVAAYVNLALEKDNTDNLEEALALYEKALALKPAADVTRERDLIEMYLDVLAYTGVEWPVVIQELQALYALEPDYRDVEQRLQEAHIAYADQLAGEEAWCMAQDEYNQAISVISTPEIVVKRDAAQTQCQLAAGAAPDTTALAALTPGAAAESAGQETDAVAPVYTDAGDGPTTGRLLYSAADAVSGRSQIMAQAVGRAASAQLLLSDAEQPAMRGDGGRLVYRNLRGDMAGLSSFDPGTGLQLRFSNYAEDSLPSWNAAGSRIVFASNREGDRRWRIYVMWAEENGGTETLTFGESPDWHSNADLVAFRGCDQSGNRCGLWTISSGGANAAQLTAVPADDRPYWSPTGSFVAFMSNARDGNYEIYTVDATSREVTRLTDSPAVDVLPAVSPDGRWVAFVSNRDGAWKLYAVPSTGGEPRVLAAVVGDMSNFLQHSLEWVD